MNAPSTIAMSAYSLAALGGPTTKAQFLDAFVLYQFQATAEQLDEALGLGLARGIFLATVGADNALVYEVRGPRGWVATDRDRNDDDGWSGWICKNLATGEKRPLAALLEESN